MCIVSNGHAPHRGRWGYHVFALSSDTTTTDRLLSPMTNKRKVSSGKSRASLKPAPSLSSEDEGSAVPSADDDNDLEENSCDSRDGIVSVQSD